MEEKQKSLKVKMKEEFEESSILLIHQFILALPNDQDIISRFFAGALFSAVVYKRMKF